MRKLSSFDAQFLTGEGSNTYGHYAALSIFEAEPGAAAPDREAVCRLVEERIDRIKPLRWRLSEVPFGLDHPSFVDGPVDVRAHVREARVLDVHADGQIGAVVERVLEEPMDKTVPLWEIHVVVGEDPSRTAIITKLHHAAADGLAAAVVLAMLFDPEPDGRELPAPDEVDGVGQAGPTERLVRGALGAAVHPLKALRVLPSALPHLDQIPALRSLPGVQSLTRGARAAQRITPGADAERSDFETAPKTRMSGALSGERRVAFRSYPVDSVREIKAANGVKFNDVVLALVAGALRRRLSADDDLPEDPLLAFVPTSVRPSGDPTFGNAISSYVVPIPTHRAAPAERLDFANATMNAAKERHRAVPNTLLADANMLIPPALFKTVSGGALRLIGSERSNPPVNVIISNVPGPPAPVYCAGTEAVEQFPLSLVFGGCGLNVTVVSYAGKLAVGIVGDRVLVPDVWELMDDFGAELEELLAQTRQHAET